MHGENWRLRDGSGRPGGLIGICPEGAVTFIENHDTEEARGGAYMAPFPHDRTLQGYAYILTHPGIPKVFWNDWYWDHRQPINALMAIRRQQGIRDNSPVQIIFADGTGHAASVNGNTAVKIGPANWSPSGTGWTLATSGSNYAVWTQGGGGGGGGGCQGCPTTVSTQPAQPTAGNTVTVWCPSTGRPLANSSQVNLSWGTNGWTSPRTTAMTNRGGALGVQKSPCPATPHSLTSCSTMARIGVITATPTGMWPFRAVAAATQVYRIEARHSGRVLEVANASSTNGANVQQRAWSGAANQQWRLEDIGNGYRRLVNLASGKCLDVAGVSTANGANIQQWDYVGGQNQQWLVRDAGNGYVWLEARHSGKAIDIQNASTANGGNAHQWSYVGAQNQQWRLIPVQ